MPVPGDQAFYDAAYNIGVGEIRYGYDYRALLYRADGLESYFQRMAAAYVQILQPQLNQQFLIFGSGNNWSGHAAETLYPDADWIGTEDPGGYIKLNDPPDDTHPLYNRGIVLFEDSKTQGSRDNIETAAMIARMQREGYNIAEARLKAPAELDRARAADTGVYSAVIIENVLAMYADNELADLVSWAQGYNAPIYWLTSIKGINPIPSDMTHLNWKTIEEWIDALEAAGELDPKLIIPGNFQVITRADLSTRIRPQPRTQAFDDKLEAMAGLPSDIEPVTDENQINNQWGVHVYQGVWRQVIVRISETTPQWWIRKTTDPETVAWEDGAQIATASGNTPQDLCVAINSNFPDKMLITIGRISSGGDFTARPFIVTLPGESVTQINTGLGNVSISNNTSGLSASATSLEDGYHVLIQTEISDRIMSASYYNIGLYWWDGATWLSLGSPPTQGQEISDECPRMVGGTKGIAHTAITRDDGVDLKVMTSDLRHKANNPPDQTTWIEIELPEEPNPSVALPIGTGCYQTIRGRAVVMWPLDGESDTVYAMIATSRYGTNDWGVQTVYTPAGGVKILNDCSWVSLVTEGSDRICLMGMPDNTGVAVRDDQSGEWKKATVLLTDDTYILFTSREIFDPWETYSTYTTPSLYRLDRVVNSPWQSKSYIKNWECLWRFGYVLGAPKVPLHYYWAGLRDNSQRIANALHAYFQQQSVPPIDLLGVGTAFWWSGEELYALNNEYNLIGSVDNSEYINANWNTDEKTGLSRWIANFGGDPLTYDVLDAGGNPVFWETAWLRQPPNDTNRTWIAPIDYQMGLGTLPPSIEQMADAVVTTFLDVVPEDDHPAVLADVKQCLKVDKELTVHIVPCLDDKIQMDPMQIQWTLTQWRDHLNTLGYSAPGDVVMNKNTLEIA